MSTLSSSSKVGCLSKLMNATRGKDRPLFCMCKHVNCQAVFYSIVKSADCATLCIICLLSLRTGMQAARGADLFHGGHAVSSSLVGQVQGASDDSHLIMRQVATQPLLQAMGIHQRLQLGSPEQCLQKTTLHAELVTTQRAVSSATITPHVCVLWGYVCNLSSGATCWYRQAACIECM